MRRAYVGIASRYGLESFWPEHHHTAEFLLRRVARHRDRGAVCFWAVMAPEFAAQIWRELAEGNRPDALILLQSLAFEVGRILPEDELESTIGAD